MGLGGEKVRGQVSKGSEVGGGHRALAHACQRAVAGHAVVRAPGHRLSILPLSLHILQSSTPYPSTHIPSSRLSMLASASAEVAHVYVTYWTLWKSRWQVVEGSCLETRAYQPAR